MERRQLIILVGNIGSGKSTIANHYVDKGYVAIARDQLRYAIGDGKYIFDYEYEPIIWSTELFMFKRFLDLGVNVIVDEIGLTKFLRKRYIIPAKRRGYWIRVIEFPKLNMKESVDRRLNNPHGQPDRKKWNDVWKKFHKCYEKPTKDEGIDEIIKLRKKQLNGKND
jgi:predicted kinase